MSALTTNCGVQSGGNCAFEDPSVRVGVSDRLGCERTVGVFPLVLNAHHGNDFWRSALSALHIHEPFFGVRVFFGPSYPPSKRSCYGMYWRPSRMVWPSIAATGRR